MSHVATHPDTERIAANLRKTIELTELGLTLRQAVLAQTHSQGQGIVQVMHEIRLAKEQAWRQSRS